MLTPLDLAAIEKAAKEPKPVAWLHNLTGLIRTDKPSLGLHEDYTPIVRDQSATILALCERIREPAKVKPLVWHRKNGIEGAIFKADGAGKSYVTWHESAEGWVDPLMNGERYDTLDEAKAAAQADYDSRIRSALITETDNG